MTGKRRRELCSVTKKLNPSVEERLKSKLAFDVLTEGEERLVWLLTFASSSSEDGNSCVDLYFVREDGSMFKAKHKFRPYFYVAPKDKTEDKVAAYLGTEYHGHFADIKLVKKEDLDPKTNSSGLSKNYLKISFDTVQQLMQVKSDLMHVVKRNQEKSNDEEAYESGKAIEPIQDSADCIDHLKEYDEPSHVRFAIDNDIRSGWWYDVNVSSDGVTLNRNLNGLQHAKVHVCAFDLKTTKLPGGDHDIVKAISYIVDGYGYLIINKQCVDKNISDLIYTLEPAYIPKSPLKVRFTVWNENNEERLIKSWFSHMRDEKPGVYVTYKEDSFNWRLLENRAAHYGLILKDELGFQCEETKGGWLARFPCRLDCFAWVKRGVILFQGSYDLKAATESMDYVPEEVTPERMALLTVQDPQMMAYYSVSDVVSTYQFYIGRIHPFIFNLTTIIPMTPDQVLREESSVLCKMLPEKFRLLADLFSSMLTYIHMINLKQEEIKDAVFSDISKGVEELRGRKLSQKDFAKMKYVLPMAIGTKNVLVRNTDSWCMEPDINVSLSFDRFKDHADVIKGLNDLFCSQLLFVVGIHSMVPDYDVGEANLHN